MSTRISCQVPFCRRTLRNDEGFLEWVCPKHWPLVPREMKARLRSVKRRVRKLQDRPEAYARALKLLDQTWARCRDTAIERAGGFS